MKTTFYQRIAQDGLCSVELWPIDEGPMEALVRDLVPDLKPPCFMVARVETTPKYRRQRYATLVMNQMLSHADDDGVTMVLQVEPDGTGADFDALGDWYKQLGFEWIGETDAMIRRPR